jgi:hypothetical protein
MISERFPQHFLHQLAGGNTPLCGQGGDLIPNRIENPQIPAHRFAVGVRGQCRDLHRCLHWWMIQAINQRFDHLAYTVKLRFKPVQPLHCSSVKGLHCTGVKSLHWSLHWCGWTFPFLLLPVEGASGNTPLSGNLPIGEPLSFEGVVLCPIDRPCDSLILRMPG